MSSLTLGHYRAHRMRQSVVLFLLFWIISLASTQILVEDVGRPELMRPDVRFLKRNNLSNMMRLGKRGLRRQLLCEDCNLGNLMRLGRR
ncbi:hypothetical protein ANCCAN_24743 [Ancylostoma caninum]|uniref:Uncharacterized protein n=1 Tax=Ancylostoma caninum TaxID=29170 RepID=A0A368FH44_ANCCA|nr:hypothetical protein ANCCAN_24743 [Ancylostoma caninum]